MKSITVKAEHPYNVYIDCDWRRELLRLSENRARIAIIFSEDFRENVKLNFETSAKIFYFPIPDGEAAKSITTIGQIWDFLAAAGFTRTDLVVAIGGGAITDVAGFAAASWLRGIDWIAIPTTIAGMVDAAVGGKTGINSEYGKNLIGAFHSPQAVLIDTSWLKTLSNRDFSAGMAEVLKCGLIANNEIISFLENQSLASLRADSFRTTALIEAAVSVKASIVSQDFRESFVREVLNYGHTLGHAIEIHSKYTFRHGEAVSIGLVFAAELANVRGVLSKEIVDLHRRLLVSLNLPITYPRGAWAELLPLLSLDKKSRGNSLRFVVISGVGQVLRVEDPKASELEEAYERISS